MEIERQVREKAQYYERRKERKLELKSHAFSSLFAHEWADCDFINRGLTNGSQSTTLNILVFWYGIIEHICPVMVLGHPSSLQWPLLCRLFMVYTHQVSYPSLVGGLLSLCDRALLILLLLDTFWWGPCSQFWAEHHSIRECRDWQRLLEFLRLVFDNIDRVRISANVAVVYSLHIGYTLGNLNKEKSPLEKVLSVPKVSPLLSKADSMSRRRISTSTRISEANHLRGFVLSIDS